MRLTLVDSGRDQEEDPQEAQEEAAAVLHDEGSSVAPTPTARDHSQVTPWPFAETEMPYALLWRCRLLRLLRQRQIDDRIELHGQGV